MPVLQHYLTFGEHLIGLLASVEKSEEVGFLAGLIAGVTPGSIAEELGIEAGDKLLSINDCQLEDIIDYRFCSADEQLELEIEKADGRMEIIDLEKDADEDLGIIFCANVFDGIRHCQNHCLFCFVDQLPPRPRTSLLLKDDDYRMSFLEGNYITGTNLQEEEIERIERLRISPLYISVHSTDPELRSRLLGHRQAGRIMPLLRRLSKAKIDIHTQIVLCPGINDGQELDRTIEDLASLYPQVCSCAIVPVGLTKYQKHKELRLLNSREAASLINHISRKQEYFRKIFGTSFVFLADEIYLNAGLPFPEAEHYEDFCQLENGVGMAALFLQEWRDLAIDIPEKVEPCKLAIISGKSGEQVLKHIMGDLERVQGLQVKLIGVANVFFGESVTVSGLLTGTCLIEALGENGKEAAKFADYKRLLLPSCLLKFGEELFLDSMSVSQLEKALGRKITVVEANAQGLFDALFNE